MDEIKFSQVEQCVVEGIKSGADFDTICKTTTISAHCAKSVLCSILRKLDILHPEIIVIKQFYDNITK